jgi:hypothetical protein
MLHDNEKKAFEKLSLFPDGIDIENFKKLNSHSKDKNIKKSIISDSILKKLQNKSLIEENSNGIKLQSIIGRFAEKKLREREKETGFFDSVFEFNYFMSDLLTDLLESSSVQDSTLSLSVFDKCQNNFLKSIYYLDEFSASIDLKVEYINYMKRLFIGICSLNSFINILNENKFVFSDIHLKAVNAIVVNAVYYNGDFESAYSKLKKIVPLDTLKDLDLKNPIERIIFFSSLHIYSMEGGQAYIYDLLDDKLQLISKTSVGIELGFFDDVTPQNIDFSYFEYKYFTNKLIITEVDGYLNSLHEKEHVERIQVSFIRAKVQPLEKKLINTFVIVNPYTLGLKYLMLAFCECDLEKARNYYIETIRNLKNIKFYYVEAIYWYAKFLKENNNKEYPDTYLNGLELSKKHKYRYLEYLFNELEYSTNLIYSSKHYP